MIIEVLLTILVMFVVITFFGYWTHVFFHSKMSGRFYVAHLTHHQKLYPVNDFQSEIYRQPGKDNTVFSFLLFGAPIILLPIILFAFHIISSPIFITIILCLAIFGFANNYLHDAFHISNHKLSRFKWFVKLTDLHYLHHIDVQKNLGIYMFWWDKLFGSFMKE